LRDFINIGELAMFILILLGLLIPLLVFFNLDNFSGKNSAIADIKIQENKLKSELRERALFEKDEYKNNMRDLWVFNECAINNNASIIALSKNYKNLKFIRYDATGEFTITQEDIISIKDVWSENIKVNYQMGSETKTVIVPTKIQNTRSPVKRAVVGAIILGPVGAIVGAASGLGGEKTIVSQEKSVTTAKMMAQSPELEVHIRTPDGIKKTSIVFYGQSHAEHWLKQIRLAKSSAA
jgi:hypothetical protein